MGAVVEDARDASPRATESATLRRVESRFEGADGRSLFRRAWLPPDARRVMIVVHGFGEHSGRYESLARTFSSNGYAVHAYDHMGHGQSSGQRGHVSDFAQFLDDLERFIAVVRAEHPETPCVLVGHSMGGLIVANLAVLRSPDVDCIITSGAALAIGRDVSPLKMKLARIIRRFWPTLSMEAGLDITGLSRDVEVVRKYEADPLVHGQATASFGASMTETIEQTRTGASRVRQAMLVLHGAADPLCDPDGSKRFFEGLPHTTVAGSAIRIYPALRHEIFNEPEREQVYTDMHSWIDERLATPDSGQLNVPAGNGGAVG